MRKGDNKNLKFISAFRNMFFFDKEGNKPPKI